MFKEYKPSIIDPAFNSISEIAEHSIMPERFNSISEVSDYPIVNPELTSITTIEKWKQAEESLKEFKEMMEVIRQYPVKPMRQAPPPEPYQTQL